MSGELTKTSAMARNPKSNGFVELATRKAMSWPYAVLIVLLHASGSLENSVDCRQGRLCGELSFCRGVFQVSQSFRTLSLRGGAVPPEGEKPKDDDVFVHLPCSKLPPPHHRCLKSALHRTKTDSWTGRRVYVRASFINATRRETPISRYGWKGPIRIGDMKFGSGNASVAHVVGDGQAQVWGQWHFGGHSIGVFQTLYTMFTEYGPYKVLMLVERQADVVMEKCEIRCFGGKCIVGRYFAGVTLFDCVVGGSAGSRATPNHKKLQIWKPETAAMVVQREVAKKQRRRGRYEKPGRENGEEVDLSKHWAPGGARHASDGASVESGAMLLGRRVCFEDSGRANGIALRCVGHARATLMNCRFQRNRINLAADATATLTLSNCHDFYFDEDRRGQRGYKGEKTEFYAHRALRLPGNGTSTLEAQDPGGGDVLSWREVTPTNRYWTDQRRRGVDPNKQAKRLRERAARKQIRARLREQHPDGIPQRVKRLAVHAPRTDFTPFTLPATPEQKRIAADPARRRRQLLEVFNAPETLGDEEHRMNPLGTSKERRGTAADRSLEALISPEMQKLAQRTKTADSSLQSLEWGVAMQDEDLPLATRSHRKRSR